MPAEADSEIRLLVMDAIANDYEDFAMICSEVGSWASERGMAASTEEVWSAFRGLVASGHAEVVLLAPFGGPRRQEVFPEISQIRDDHYFTLTNAGREELAREAGT